MPMSSEPMMSSGEVIYEPAAPSETTLKPSVAPDAKDAPSSSDVAPVLPPEPTVPAVEPAPAAPTPAPMPLEPAPAEAAAEPAPAEPAPVEPAPLEPAPAEPAPAEAMEDDLFGTPEAAPAEQPAAPVEAEPMPAADGADDLFGAPAAEPAAPAAAPAPADDIFGAPEAAPAAEPAAPAPADDLFGAPEAAPAAEPAADNLFDAPMDEAAPAAEPAPADDLFGPPADQPAKPAAPAEEPKTDLDDLFGETSAPRVWVDNSGTFKTEGRLVEIGSDFVRLLKTNGRTCTVPMSRLSSEDAEFVAAVAQQQTEVKLAMNSSR